MIEKLSEDKKKRTSHSRSRKKLELDEPYIRKSLRSEGYYDRNKQKARQAGKKTVLKNGYKRTASQKRVQKMPLSFMKMLDEDKQVMSSFTEHWVALKSSKSREVIAEKRQKKSRQLYSSKSRLRRQQTRDSSLSHGKKKSHTRNLGSYTGLGTEFSSKTINRTKSNLSGQKYKRLDGSYNQEYSDSRYPWAKHRQLKKSSSKNLAARVRGKFKTSPNRGYLSTMDDRGSNHGSRKKVRSRKQAGSSRKSNLSPYLDGSNSRMVSNTLQSVKKSSKHSKRANIFHTTDYNDHKFLAGGREKSRKTYLKRTPSEYGSKKRDVSFNSKSRAASKILATRKTRKLYKENNHPVEIVGRKRSGSKKKRSRLNLYSLDYDCWKNTLNTTQH